ncbi:MAG: endonuclease NucS domain-containing protein [Pyrinomonadaceae bacterium]
MSEEIRIWQVENGQNLCEVRKSKLDFEERLQEWLIDDISILSPDLLIIGREVETDYGKYIDLLCIDSNGDLTVIELKRDKTPREVTAQVLDYASWVKDLSNERVTGIANLYLSKASIKLDEAFQQKFGAELPEILNDSHSMLIVASEIDESTERIIKYLSSSYGVKINVAQFQYFKGEDGKEYLAKVFLIEEAEVEQKAIAKGVSKRAKLTLSELEQVADEKGVGDFYRQLFSGLEAKFIVRTGRTMLRFRGRIDDNKWKALFNVVPEKSSVEDGLYFQIYTTPFSKYSGLNPEVILSSLPSSKRSWKYYEGADEDFSGYDGFFNRDEEIEKFLQAVQNIVRR